MNAVRYCQHHHMTRPDANVNLLTTDGPDRRFQDALEELFAGDGTVYIVSGYFTFQGYRAIRDHIVSFLNRSPENELIAVVGPASDQFSARIAHDLWALDTGQVHLYKQPHGLHAKLYLRDGPNPQCIVGSANITQVAFQYNIELSIELHRPNPQHPDIEQFLTWVTDLIADSEPLRRRDIYAPVQMTSSFHNWSNKARLLPRRDVALRVLPVLLLIVMTAGLFRLV